MAHNQGGLTGIEAISGTVAENPALQSIAQLGNFFNYTMVNFGKGSEVTGNRAFNTAEVLMNFGDDNAVGINPFGNPVLPEGAGGKLHSIG